MDYETVRIFEGPIYDENGNFDSFSYTTFQDFLDSQFRKDLYRALNTNDYEAFCEVRIQDRNLPRWLCESIYEYACKRNCNIRIIACLKSISFEKFLVPEQIHISKGDIINGWKVKEVIYSEIQIDKVANSLTDENFDEYSSLPEIKGYILEKRIGD